MVQINAKGSNLSFKDIGEEDLPKLQQWYNQREFMYATGADSSNYVETLQKKYVDAKNSDREFFTGIYAGNEQKLVGMMKGFLKDPGEDAVWINAMLIDSDHQNQGFGTEAIDLLLGQLKEKKNVRRAYLSVVEENEKGVNFWRKNGFEEVKKIHKNINVSKQSENICIMKKELQ